MRNFMQWLLAIVFILLGGITLGAVGLALGGVATGLLMNSGRRGFLISGMIAAFFWLIAAVSKALSGQLLTLAGSLANFSGAQAWLLVLVSLVIAFLASGLGGWLGGSLRQINREGI